MSLRLSLPVKTCGAVLGGDSGSVVTPPPNTGGPDLSGLALVAANGFTVAGTLADLGEITVSGQDRVKVWLRADAVNESEAVPLQLKISTTGYRTAVFQILIILIDRMH